MKLAQGYKGGPLASYGQSFGGLRGFYNLQKPGATQHEQLQNEAVNQQEAAGGFYRPGSEPKVLTPPAFNSQGASQQGGTLAPPLPDTVFRPPNVTAGTLALKPSPYVAGPSFSTGGDVYQQPSDTIPLLGETAQPPPTAQPQGFAAPRNFAGATFARPPGMDSTTPPDLTAGGALPAGGRSMTDPNRVVETIARGHRGDPRTQIAAADFFRGNADRAARDEAARAQGAWEAHKFEVQQGGAAMTRQEVNRHHEEQERARRESQGTRDAHWEAENARKQAEYERSLQKPEVTTTPIPGTNFIIPFAGNKPMGTLPTNAPPKLDLQPLPGTSQFYPTINGKPDLARPFTQTSPGAPPVPEAGPPLLPQFQHPAMPGMPPTFAPLPKDSKTASGEKPHIVSESVKNDEGKVTGTVHWEFFRDDKGMLRKRKIEEEKPTGPSSNAGEVRQADEQRIQEQGQPVDGSPTNPTNPTPPQVGNITSRAKAVLKQF